VSEKMKAIRQDDAMICIKEGCELIWEGPSTFCPGCGWQGARYRELEALATGIPLGYPEPTISPKMLTEMIQ
jgi:hypothetical protein